MPRDMIVRGIDDKVHSQLGDIASKTGVSLNSIVKDAVDKWLEHNSQITKKHELVLYTDDESLLSLLKSIDYVANSDNVFRACCGPKTHTGMQFLKKHGWFDGTVEPYKKFLDNPNSYGSKVLEKIGGKVDKRQLFALAFLTGDLAEHQSPKKAVKFCQWYDKQGVPGITHCVADSKNIITGSLEDALELFQTHDQVYIAKKDGLHKIHVTRENIHKLFLN